MQNTPSPDILILKGTKQLSSVYDKMPMVYDFSNASVTFQFRFCPIADGLFAI